ncbi:unnamed protein product [Didymodactylos carnosus]|uniref:Ig-like domain-containing protein n=1 Tax=Didymodactylos carnosus TaxID=1234261 RepID=A0A815ZXB7_9BILA|nr:unnamed protein product [Didymodactylos carnosus]CAF1589897.1 unnamed protein product [Didymodactylos carnosus]CAF4360283.1 unnamed protein product [Didymodactylos carnosus]CAF4461396.1 unnamed protein product [Didymodactylos carnosus]
MVLPRIRNLDNNSHFEMHESNNNLKKLVCIGEGYPEPQIMWIRDSIHIASNRSRAVLELESESHGLNKYVCQAKNQHGLVRIFITVTIPDDTAKTTLSYTDLQAQSIVLHWRMSNDQYKRFNHFIIYYRQWDNNNDFNHEYYEEILVDGQAARNSFTFRVSFMLW